MLTTDIQPDLTKEEFDLFRDFIHEKAGIFFADNKMYLVKNRLVKRIGELGIKSFKDYFYMVKYDVSMKEFNNLMNMVTTNETSFFRNPPQLKSFAEEALPMIVKEKMNGRGNRTLKIWSAGCSTGEEPYTLAIILLEHFGGSLAGWNIEIVATDISENVLLAARKGIHHKLSLRTTPLNLIPKYFDQDDDKYRVKPVVKNMVRFGYLNLNDSRKLSMYSNMDFIFCRNVMIYFSEEVKRQLVRGFYDSLRPGGYFYIGHSESLHGISKAFKLVYFKSALVYHKEAAGQSTDASQKTESTQTANYISPTAAPSGANKAMELLKKIKPMTTK